MSSAYLPLAAAKGLGEPSAQGLVGRHPLQSFLRATRTYTALSSRSLSAHHASSPPGQGWVST